MKYTLLTFLLVVGCSSSSNTGTGSGGAGGTSQATGGGAGQATGGGAGGAGGTADAGSGFTLQLQNYLDWCNVTDDGTSYPATDVPTMTFPAGTVVHLDAMAASATFVWGYWTGTDGDTTATHDTSMTTTVTMTGNKKVQACCPFASSPNQPCPAF